MSDSSSECLLEAAALMRSRAEASVPGPWPVEDNNHLALPMAQLPFAPNSIPRRYQVVGGPSSYELAGPDDATTFYIASWHPAVALAVADWLEKQAEMSGSGNGIPAMRGRGYEQALSVARAYLGGPSD